MRTKIKELAKDNIDIKMYLKPFLHINEYFALEIVNVPAIQQKDGVRQLAIDIEKFNKQLAHFLGRQLEQAILCIFHI